MYVKYIHITILLTNKPRKHDPLSLPPYMILTAFFLSHSQPFFLLGIQQSLQTNNNHSSKSVPPMEQR